VILNFFGTLRGQGAMLRSSLPLRWFFVGMVNYAITCLQCAFQATLTLQQVIHFTDWVVGHAHLVMFGVFGFWITGMVVELWPRLVGRPWHSRRWLEWQFWLSTVGITVMFLDLVAAGLLQGFLWKALAPWSDSVIFSVPFWWVRLVSGLLITAGAGLFFANLWLTARAPVPIGAPERAVDAAGGRVAEPA
jgi:cytochrome c oxidase cbb3-type subunit 1